MRIIDFSKASNSNVISSGKSQLASLQENLYLHNMRGNYQEISNFSPVDISIMDKIATKIISQQLTREQYIYHLLGVKNIKELNQKYMEVGGNSDFINTTIDDILIEASKRAFGDLIGVTRNKGNEKALSNSFNEVVNEMIEGNYNNEEIVVMLQDGLGEELAQRLAKAQNTKKKPRMMNKSIEKLSEQMKPYFRGMILEHEVEAVMDQLMELTINSNKRSGVRLTAMERNDYGKQIKADVTLEFFGDDRQRIGISAKNYTFENGIAEISLHSANNLENFYKLITEMGFSGNVSEIMGMQNIINSFRTPYFKYHLINQAAFWGVKKGKNSGAHIEDTDVGQNIVNFVKRCLPLFIGTQMKIKGDDINVDFFNISGKLVPVSTVLQSVFNGSFGDLRVSLYSNYNIPWVNMRTQKMNFPVEDGQFYSEGAQRVGGYYGEQVYKNIKVGTIHLKVALSSFK